jgi:hypothetical protein
MAAYTYKRIGWYDPSTLAQMVSNSKLVVQMSSLGVETDGYQWETFTASFGHDDKAEMFECCGEVIRSTD